MGSPLPFRWRRHIAQSTCKGNGVVCRWRSRLTTDQPPLVPSHSTWLGLWATTLVHVCPICCCLPPLSSSLTQGIVFPEGPALLTSVVLKSRASSPFRFVFIRWSFYCTVLKWNKHKHPKWDKCFLSIKNESNFKWYQRSMVQFIRGTNARFKFVIFNIKFQSNTLFFLSPNELMFSFIFFLASLYHRLQIWL
jgi:hypothetical protein